MEMIKKIITLIYHLLKAILIDLSERCFQCALQYTVFELEICTLRQNGIEFHQTTNGECFRIEMQAKLAICRHFLFTNVFLLIIKLPLGPARKL